MTLENIQKEAIEKFNDTHCHIFYERPENGRKASENKTIIESFISTQIAIAYNTGKDETVSLERERCAEIVQGKMVIGMTAEECKCCNSRNEALEHIIQTITTKIAIAYHAGKDETK